MTTTTPAPQESTSVWTGYGLCDGDARRKAIVHMLAQEGAQVVVHGRNRERAEAVAKAIGAAGVAIGELAEDGAAQAVHAEAIAALGGNVEILINNAGGNSEGNSAKKPHEIDAADFLSNYRANTLGAVPTIPQPRRRSTTTPSVSPDRCATSASTPIS